jgi:toxin HigB-1
LTLVTLDVVMILTFGDKETELIWSGIRVKNMPVEIQVIGRRKLRMLNNSQTIIDLRIPPSNRFEKLSGNFEGYYSIRINNQWRIIFQWIEGQSEQVKILDYH